MTVHPARRPASILAGALALLIGVPSLLVLYFTFSILNRDAFVRRLNASLEDPGVAEFAAQRITDLVIAQRRDLTALRPVLITVTRGIVSSAPFHAMLAPAAGQVHTALFSSTNEQILLSVPDAALLLRSTLANLNPAAAQKIPSRLTSLAARPDTPVARMGLRALRLAHAGRQFARTGVVLSLILLVVAIYVAPSRRSALLSCGAATAALGFGLTLLVPVGRFVIESPVTDPVARAAMGGLWGAFAGRLWIVGAVLGAVGLTLIVAATSTIEGFEIGRLMRDGWRTLTTSRPTPWVEILRVIGVGLGGLLVFTFPTTALRVVASVAGVGLFVLGLQGLVRFTRPHPPGARASTETELHYAAVLTLAFRVTVILLLGFGALGLVLRLRPRPEATAVATEGCNGSVALCDRPINRIVWAGAHNAMGSADNPGWLFPNQDVGIPALLEQGVRVFMLDVHYGRRFGDKVKTDFEAEHASAEKYKEALGAEGFEAAMRIRDRLTGESGPLGVFLCHGFCELGALSFDSTLQNFSTFLASNPGEVVVLDLEDYVPPEDVARIVEESGFIDYVYRGPLDPPLPTLRQLIAAGGRALIFGEHEVGQIPWYHAAYDLMQETPYTFHAPSEFSCRPNRGARTNPLLLINHWIETTPTPKPSNAEIVNAREALLRRARQCQRERGMVPNILAVDFAGTGDLVGATRVLNGIDTSAAPPPR